ncbi:MAG: diaminopimelate decarboxylase [Deltaproteobacteria bacterium]|nr:diaminopimelate decarboxylase [Deltaproteobacteria bacterium]
MHHFKYRGDQFYCEDVPVREIAEAVGTPFYLYSTATLERHYLAFEKALKGTPHRICYSVKANSNLAVLALFARLGSGFDIVSGGELIRVLRAGGDPGKVVFSGVGKGTEEIRAALEAGILLFNVESLPELREIDRVAGSMGKTAPVAFRVNPDVDPKTHPYISTGLKRNKFGIPIEEAGSAYRLAVELDHVEPIGVDCHIGSQLTEMAPFLAAVERVKGLIGALKAEGIAIRYFDLGGGLGISYDEEEPPHPTEYGRALIRHTQELDCTMIFEPGRVIVGNAGILVTRVRYTKENLGRKFIIVDAGMNDLARPSLYQAYHRLQAVERKITENITADVVGPICESGDFLAQDREIQPYEQGDLMAVMSVGGYGFVMSSNYNTRPRVPEVLVSGGQYHIVRKRETVEELMAGESIPPILQQ